jgi:hypothetical protein
VKFNLDEEWLRRRAKEEDNADITAGSIEEAKHDYPPVWDETLKSWINRPPFAKPGQGAKI